MTAPLLLSVFPTFAVGGAQTRFATLVNHLGGEWRHAIVSMDGNVAARERLDADLSVSFIDPEVRKGDLLGNVSRFRALLRTLDPTTLLTHNFGSIEWAMANRRRLVRQVHVEDGFGPEERDSQFPRRVWLRRVFLRGHSVVLPSRALLHIAQQVWRLRPRDVTYIPNGIDVGLFESPFQPRTWPGQGPVIGTVAALRPEKNIARLVRAFAEVSRQTVCRLVLIGDGPERPTLEALTRQFGMEDRIFFEGHVREPSALIRSLDIFAISSDTEQMPLSLIEAMAAGLPVVTTGVGDVSTMLSGPNQSFVVPCEDSAIAQALSTLVHDVDLCETLGRANRDKANQNFNQSDMFARWSDVLTPPAQQ